jgi:NarL family two-component system response regulator LiaR
MNKKIIIFAIVIATIAMCLELLKYKLVIFDLAVELYATIISITFLTIGLYTGKKFIKPKEVIVEKHIHVPHFTLNEKGLEQLGLSKRECEILELMAKGLSNQEIATHIFLSVNTVKTHVSNILLKLDAKRRTEAITKARQQSLIP